MPYKHAKFLEGTGYTLHQGPDGFWLEIDGADAGADDFPFNVKLSGLKYKVTPGTVNGVMAKMLTKRLDDVPPPEDTISATAYIYLKCQHNAGESFPVSVTVEHYATAQSSDEEFLYIHIATVNVKDGKATKTAQVVRTSLAAEYFKCGSSAPEYYVSQA